MPAPQQAERSSLTSTIGHIAGTICSNSFPSSNRARLRRITSGQPLPLAFIHFGVAHLPEDWEYQIDDWAALVSGLAIMAPHAHRPGYGLGRALAETSYSEARLERLLGASGDTRRALLLRAARYLAAKQMPCDWLDATRLLLTCDTAKLDAIRLTIARDYFSNLHTETAA